MRTSIAILFVFTFTFSLGNLQNRSSIKANNSSSPNVATQLIPQIAANDFHDPISLTNNTQLENQAASDGWAGNGTVENPYIIENYLITDASVGIYLVDITKYVCIQNVQVHSSSVYTGYGIRLINCDNVKIKNTELKYWAHGVSVQNSRDCQVEQSSFVDGMYAIRVYDSALIVIDGNTFDSIQGILHFTNVSESELSSNIVHSTIISPTFEIYYSKGITIFGNTLNNTGSGIAIVMVECEDFEISYNIFENHYHAIILSGSSNNIIMKNTFKNCAYSLYLDDSISNIIYWNNFIEITYLPEIYTDSVTNLWYNEEIGNYWSEKPANASKYLIWSLTPIEIYDEYPFNRPVDIVFPTIVTIPASIQYRKILDDAPQLNWTVTDENPSILEIKLNGSAYNTTTWTSSPMEMKLPDFDVGNYTMDFTFYDIDNNTVSFQVDIEVTASLVANVVDFALENQWYLIGGGGGLLVLVIVGIVIKSKKK